MAELEKANSALKQQQADTVPKEEIKQLQAKYAILNRRVLDERKQSSEELKRWKGKCGKLEKEIEALVRSGRHSAAGVH